MRACARVLDIWEPTHFHRRGPTLFCPGTVVIRNVRLRSDLLALFGLPITLQTATVAKLSIILPWKNLDDQKTVG